MNTSVAGEKLGAEFQEYANDESVHDVALRRREAALVRKLDCFIAPVMMLLMLISYLDRGNIGFAATQGMAEDIGLKGSQLNTAVSVFYIFYILAEFPTSILVKRLQFNRVIPTITFCWGIVCLCTGFIRGFGALVVTRILLGFFEGCLFPSMTLFLCNWYKREELAVRVSYLFIASALSGAFGGLLAWAILYMDGVSGYPGWRWLYIIEGIITVIWAAICIFVVPKNYETAYFLNDEDKALMRQRAEHMEAYSGGSGHYGKKDIKEAANDVKSWLHGVIQIAVVTILYGFGTFLPIIIKNGFHYSTVQAQYLVIPGMLYDPSVRHTTDKFHSKSVGSPGLRRGRVLERQVSNAFLSLDHLRSVWHCWLRDMPRTSLSRCAVLRNIPHRYRMLSMHGREHRLALRKLRTGREAGSKFGDSSHPHEYWGCGRGSDLPDERRSSLLPRSWLVTWVSCLGMVWLVGSTVDL